MATADTLERRQVLRLQSLATAPTTANDTDRTIELVVATETAVDGLVLRCQPGSVQYGPAPVPVLLNHANHTGEMAGRLLSVRFERGQLIALAQFTDAPGADAGWQLARAGCAVSVGATFTADAIEHGRGDGPDVVTIWRLREASLVAVGADPMATTRAAAPIQTIALEGNSMNTVNNTLDREELTLDRIERKRCTAILDCARKLQVDEALALDLIERGVALDEARLQLIDARSAEERKTPGVARTEVGHGHSRLAPLEDGLLKRLQQQAGGISLLRVMEDLTGRRGSSDELLQRAMSTSDFPALFAGAGARFMREMYNAAGVGARLIAKGRQSSDLRDINLLGLSEFPGLLKLGEGGEIKYGNFTDRGGSYRVEEFARGVRLTRRAMLTDDLDAFSEALASYGRAIAALEDQLVIDALETGATGAKSMEDGKALFHADHQNSTTATALGISSLGEATRRLRGMKETGNGRALNLTPRWVLVPATHEVQALQLCTAINATESSAVNPFGAGSLALEPIVDANLGGSYAYVLADPAGPAAAIELCTGPAVADVQTQSDFDTTSLKTRVLADRGLGVRDHRGIVRIPLGS
jgi:phage major head subunit gpT-like protein